jgi:hypothetical protein
LGKHEWDKKLEEDQQKLVFSASKDANDPVDLLRKENSVLKKRLKEAEEQKVSLVDKN